MRPARHEGPLPNLLVIGAQKCGTTSLHAYLDAHPDVFMAREKELDFFISAEDSLPTMPANWERGVGWYRAQFRDARATVLGESSPNYTVHPFVRGVAQRAGDVLPKAKLVYLVRDPIERAISHYVHQVAAGRERRPIDEALAVSAGAPSGYLLRSMYAMQLRQWLEAFGTEQILVVEQEGLLQDRSSTLSRVFSFVGVDPVVEASGTERRMQQSSDKRAAGAVERRLRHGRMAGVVARLPRAVRRPLGTAVRTAAGSRIGRPELQGDTRSSLEAALAEDVEALRRMTGRSFPDWSV